MSQQLSVFIWLDTGLCKMWIMRVRGRSAFVLREECPSFDFRDTGSDSVLDGLDSGGSENVIGLDELDKRDEAKRQSTRDGVQKTSFKSEIPLRPLTLHYQQGIFELEKSTEDDTLRFHLVSVSKKKGKGREDGDLREAFTNALDIDLDEWQSRLRGLRPSRPSAF
ncbi:hypothetical protein WG66_005974 [Moniliophthora roreri]|nr:hypothetical protein WG66_005974 [Moniliophthora roreri]